MNAQLERLVSPLFPGGTVRWPDFILEEFRPALPCGLREIVVNICGFDYKQQMILPASIP